MSKEFLFSTINFLETKLRVKLKSNFTALPGLITMNSFSKLYSYLHIHIIENRDVVSRYLNDEYAEGVENLIHYCIFNSIKKAELQCFLSKIVNFNCFVSKVKLNLIN